MSYVVAVAAPIGGGKTSVVRAVAHELGDATTIHYDRYEKATAKPVQDLKRWIENGADINEFRVPGLSRDLEMLKRGTSVMEPLTGREIAPRKYIIFEMPFGKEHRDTAGYIDLLIWIDLPLDIALARKLKEFTRDFLTEYGPEKHKDCITWLDHYLENYLAVVRDALEIQQQRVPEHADVIIDGRASVPAIVQQATRAILDRLP